MSETRTTRKPGQLGGPNSSRDGLAQVILYNDDHNEAGYVVQCLMRVFTHPAALAEKIMIEAHLRGRAIAEVEGLDQANAHCAQLQKAGLGATVESI